MQSPDFRLVTETKLTNALANIATPNLAGKADRWQSNTSYTQGQYVQAPDGSTVSAIASFTSGATYNSANWSTVVSTSASIAGTYVTYDGTNLRIANSIIPISGNGTVTISAFATVSAMKATRPADNMYATTSGYYAANDRGGAMYRYSASSTASDDGGSVLTPTIGSGAGRWLLVTSTTANARWFGARGDGTTSDTAALTKWLAYLATTGLEGYWDAGLYSTASGLTLPIEGARIRGAGQGVTTVLFADSNNDGLTLGPGPSGGTASPYGWMPAKNFGYLRGISLFGPTANPTKNVKAAVVLNTLRHAQLTDVNVGNYDIGFDFRNNCFGVTGWHLGSDPSCNVGLNLRNGDGSGSDLGFYNCWLGGGVSISGDGGGYLFSKGQIGYSSALDAAVSMCKDYESGAISGTRNIVLDDVDFESFSGYALRSYNTIGLTVRDVLFGAYQTGAAMAVGILSMNNPYASKVRFEGANFVEGNYSAAKLLNVTGSELDMFSIDEDPWMSGVPTVINGVTVSTSSLPWMTSLQEQSSIWRGTARYRHDGHTYLSIEGAKIRRNTSTGALEVAPQGSGTYAALGGSTVVDNGDGTLSAP